MIYTEPSKRSVIVRCDCGSEFICFEYDGEEHFINLYIDTFYANQTSFFGAIKERVKMAWYALTGKKYYLFDIQVSKENMDKLVHYLREYVDRSS
jgi:hypothetical protein